MKKILLSVSTLVLALTANAQNSNAHAENMDGVTPCFLSYEGGPGAFQGAAGHDFKNMQWDQANNVMTFDATTHATLHGPLYYTLSGGDAVECKPGEGLVDLSTNQNLSIRAKASVPFKISVYVQEGNSPSWDYSKFSQTPLVLDLTTEYQIFSLNEISNKNFSDGDVDLTNIGTVVFELGKDEDEKFYQVSGATVSVDWIKLGEHAVSTNSVVAKSFSVYPNPATDVLTVEADVVAASSVELVDLSGKLVATQSVGAGFNKVQFNVANVNAGLYFLSVRSANGVVTQKVIVK